MVAPAPDLAVLNPQMYSHCQEKVLQNHWLHSGALACLFEGGFYFW